MIEIYTVAKDFDAVSLVNGKKVSLSFKEGDKVMGTKEGDLLKLRLKYSENGRDIYYDYYKPESYFTQSITTVNRRLFQETLVLASGLLLGLLLKSALKK